MWKTSAGVLHRALTEEAEGSLNTLRAGVGGVSGRERDISCTIISAQRIVVFSARVFKAAASHQFAPHAPPQRRTHHHYWPNTLGALRRVAKVGERFGLKRNFGVEI